MSDLSASIKELLAVLGTAEGQLNAVFGLTLGFDDGLSLRVKAAERSDTFLHKCGYSAGRVTLASAESLPTEVLMEVIGLGDGPPPGLRTTTISPGDDPGPLSVEPEELEAIDDEPITVDPVAIEPVTLAADPPTMKVEPSEPAEDDGGVISIEPEPMELMPETFSNAEEDESDDATQLFTRGAIPMDWDDDDGESTVVLDRDAAAALMEKGSDSAKGEDEEHFDLISPEEVEPEALEPMDLETDAFSTREDATDEVPAPRSKPVASRVDIPQVRAASERPGAAAIQIGGPTGARVMAPEEEDEIAVEAAPDDEDYEYDSDGGFGLALSEDDYEEYEEEEEEAAEEPPAPPPPPIVIPPGPSQEVIQGFIDRARRESEDGSLEDAARSYSDALDGEPRQGEIRLARGRIFMDMGDYSRAVSDFLIAEEIMPESAEPQVLMGELYSHRKDYAKAQGYLDIALRLDPRHPMAYYRRGLCFLKTRDYKKAVDDLGRARALDEGLPGIDHFLGQAMKKAKTGR